MFKSMIAVMLNNVVCKPTLLAIFRSTIHIYLIVNYVIVFENNYLKRNIK